ncbi:MAG: GNAT family N-acetyltransferase [Erythrobacter sp.]
MPPMPRDPIITRAALEHDRPAINATLAEAFQNEPAFSFILPDPDARRKTLQRAFPIITREDMKAGCVMMTAGAEAATSWRRPWHMHETRWEAIRTRLPFLRAFGPAIGRAALVGGLIREHLPQEPCWYLHFAGCHSHYRGKGFGGAAIRAGLARADLTRAKAYLETADEANIPIYRALGFEIIQSWQVPDGPQFWGMMRAGR